MAIGRRPTKGMMLAVNAAIDENKSEVERLVKEHDLDRAELRHRIRTRDGSKYELGTPAAGARKTSRKPRPTRGKPVDLDVTINGRTSVRQLFKLIEQASQIKAQAQQELARRPSKEIEPVKRAMAEIELLRRQRAKLERKIRDAEDSL